MTWTHRPLDSIVVTDSYGAARGGTNTRRPNHNGTDFRAAVGTPVFAVADGEVRRARDTQGPGGVEVILRLDDGSRAGYSHLSSLAVSVGQRVEGGQELGRSGITGNVTGPHLHFTAAAPGQRLGSTDPISLIPDASDEPNDPSPGEGDPGNDPGPSGGLVALAALAILVLVMS